MTSQKSSISTFAFTFLNALKGSFILPLLNTIALIGIAPLSCFLFITRFKMGYYGYVEADLTGPGITNRENVITDLYKYVVFNDFEAVFANVAIHFLIIVVSILLAVLMFRFINSKKTVNVYYSLGITRGNQYFARYLAGLLMMTVSIAIPFLICLFINISVFGSSKELWSAILFYIGGYCSLSFFTFSLTAAVISGVGTIAEGIAFSGILMLSPTMLIFSIEQLMKKLTWGAPFGNYFYYYDTGTNSLLTKAGFLNPILFLFKDLAKTGALSRESKDLPFEWTAPQWSGVIIWLAAAVIMFGVGLLVYKRRKAEIAGFFGTNKWLNFISVFVFGFFAVSICVNAIPNLAIAIVAGVAIFTVIYALADFVFIRNFKEWLRGFKKLPIHLGLSLLIVLIFATGLFGYSYRIPEIDRIESVEVTPLTSWNIAEPMSVEFGNTEYIFTFRINRPVEGFKSDGDLQKITALHKKIIDDGRLELSARNSGLPAEEQAVESYFKIRYKLKNGRELTRAYTVLKSSTMTQLLTLEETDRYKELVSQVLTQPLSDKDSNAILAAKDFFQSEQTDITFYSSNLNKYTATQLSLEKRLELLAALAEDLQKQTAEQRYHPEEPALGVISFQHKGQFFDAFGTDTEMWTETETEIDTETEMETGAEANAKDMGFERVPFGYGCYGFPITRDMKATLEFLRSENLLTLFDTDDDGSFVSARIISAVKTSDSIYDSYDNPSHHFVAAWSQIDSGYGSFSGAYEINDKALVDEIASNAHLSYFSNTGGYFIRFRIENAGGYMTAFVTEEKMPESIKKAVREHHQVRKEPFYPNYDD